MTTIHIQVQFVSGEWRTVRTLIGLTGQHLAHALKDTARAWPRYRVRAVDEGGRLVDLL